MSGAQGRFTSPDPLKTLAAATLVFTGGAGVAESAPVVAGIGRWGLQRLVLAAADPQLKDIVSRLYQDTDEIPGGTAGAFRNEVSTGGYIEHLGGNAMKAAQRFTQLERLINSGHPSGSDQMIAGHIISDLKNALGRYRVCPLH